MRIEIADHKCISDIITLQQGAVISRCPGIGRMILNLGIFPENWSAMWRGNHVYQSKPKNMLIMLPKYFIIILALFKINWKYEFFIWIYWYFQIYFHELIKTTISGGKKWALSPWNSTFHQFVKVYLEIFWQNMEENN